jgi:hypothetical protein
MHRNFSLKERNGMGISVAGLCSEVTNVTSTEFQSEGLFACEILIELFECNVAAFEQQAVRTLTVGTGCY